MASDVHVEMTARGISQSVDGSFALVFSRGDGTPGLTVSSAFMGSLRGSDLALVATGMPASVRRLAERGAADPRPFLMLLASAALREIGEPSRVNVRSEVDYAALDKIRRMAEGLGIDADL